MVLDSAANRQITDSLRRQLRLLTPDQIRRNRESLGLTQKQLASQLGIAEATMSRWETGGQIQQRALDRLLRLYFAFASVRDTLADEDRLAELGTSPGPHAETEVELEGGPRSTPSEAAVRQLLSAVTECLSSEPVKGTLRDLLSSSQLLAERWEANLSSLTDLMAPMVVWSFATDQRSLDSWRNLFRKRLALALSAQARPGEEDRWFVAPLRMFSSDDTEQASRLSRLAQALDALPRNKQASAVQEFQHLMELMK